MRATLLCLACVVAAAGCDGLLGINQHTLAEAGAHGDGAVESDGGGHANADASGAGEQ